MTYYLQLKKLTLYTQTQALFLADVRNKYENAETLYRKAIKLDPNHANSLYNYGVMLDSTRKDYDNAEKYYREAIRANPKHAYALYNLAVLLEEIRKDNDGAE